MTKRTLALAILLLPGVSSAGPLAPGRASDLVTLITKDLTPCAVAGVAFDTRVLPDGSAVPFTIPAKHVLVVTSLHFVAGAAPVAGQTGTAVLTLATATTSHAVLQAVGVTDSDGTYAGSAHSEQGVAVRAGATLCLLGGTSTSGVLHGFLAKDK